MHQRLLLVASACLVCSTGAFAADANLDPTFGTFGATTVNHAPGAGTTDRGDDVALQVDGKVVVAGTSGTGGVFAGDVLVTRFSAAGVLDGTFGAGGVVATGVGGSLVEGVALQSDGKILVVGTGDTAGNYGAENSSTLLVRYTSGGVLDGGFGTGGVVKLQATPGYEAGMAVVEQPDGRIVVAGFAFPTLPPISVRPGVLIARFLADGTPDGSFGAGGVALIPPTTSGSGNPAAGGDFGTAVALQPDGKIVVGGYRYVAQGPGIVQTFLVLRADAGGVLDPAFGAGGISTGGPGPEGSRIANGLELMADGRIVLGGLAGARLAAARYLPNGSPDGAFDADGFASVTPGGSSGVFGTDVVVDPAGRVTVVGSVSDLARTDGAIARFAADGSADGTFAPGGVTRVVIGGASSALTGAARQPDGKIVVSAQTAEAFFQPTADSAFAVARFGGTCGDTVLDAGEQCDDGNTDGSDCCSAGCGFDPAGQSCTAADASPCTWDVCDGSGSCQVGGPRPAGLCRAVSSPGRALLSITNASSDAKDKLAWKWNKGAEVFLAELGLPAATTEYRLCVFGGGVLAGEHVIPAGPGWTLAKATWKLKRDPAATGISKALLRAAVGVPGQSKAQLKGKGALLAPAALPLATPVAAQLISDQGLCLTSTFATPARNDASHFKAKGQ